MTPLPEQIADQRRYAETLQRDIQEKQATLKTAQKRLTDLEKQCNGGRHVWSDPVYAGHYEPGYYIPGDRESGREMGVDSLPGVQVSGKQVNKWTRTCKVCGKVEETNQTQTLSTQVPKF